MLESNFFTDVIRNDPRFETKSRVYDLSLIEPVMRQRVKSIIAEAQLKGITLVLFETFRSKARQRQLFAQGVTQLPEIGVHHFGLACDLVISVGGVLSWEADYSIVGGLAARYDLLWGGDWGRADYSSAFTDPVHVQRCALSDQDSLFAGMWYPNNLYLTRTEQRPLDIGRQQRKGASP